MPIRFRCAYCNQLLGIARRKAGTVVRCPTCAGQVVVPNVELDDTDSGGPSNPLVFERSDFEELLNPQEENAVGQQKRQAVLSSSESPVALPMTEPPAGAWGTHAEPAFDVSRLHPQPPVSTPAPPAGILLSPARATLFLILGVIALAIAFGAGVLLGYFLRSGQESQTGRRCPLASPALSAAPDPFQHLIQTRHIERQGGNLGQIVIA